MGHHRRCHCARIDPVTPGTLYVAAYGGIFKSTDANATWHAANAGVTNLNVTALAIDPIAPGALYAGTYGGVFKSTDAGVTWAAANAGLTNLHIFALAIDPITPGLLYVGTASVDSSGETSVGRIFKSTDGAANWYALENLPVDSGGLIGVTFQFVIDPITPGAST